MVLIRHQSPFVSMQAKNRGKKPLPPPKSASMDEEAMPMFTKLTAVKP